MRTATERGGQEVKSNAPAPCNGCCGTPLERRLAHGPNPRPDHMLATPAVRHDACTWAQHPNVRRTSVTRMRAGNVAAAIVALLSGTASALAAQGSQRVARHEQPSAAPDAAAKLVPARGTLARSERFDAAQVVRSCVALERPLARRRGVALQGLVTLSNVFLQGDPNALYQVLTNLIRNAVAASLETRQPVVVTLEQTGELLRLGVEDRGVGIPVEHLERIFEPGFTTREFGSGSGTGLTVVSQITREMFGGGVEVRSTVGQGATFTVNLPIPPQRTPRRR